MAVTCLFILYRIYSINKPNYNMLDKYSNIDYENDKSTKLSKIKSFFLDTHLSIF